MESDVDTETENDFGKRKKKRKKENNCSSEMEISAVLEHWLPSLRELV